MKELGVKQSSGKDKFSLWTEATDSQSTRDRSSLNTHLGTGS